MSTMYGLPEKVVFCERCTISNQRPNSCVEFEHTPDSTKETIAFEDGVCSACHAAEQKDAIDWEARERELVELCARFRGDGTRYDCLVPGSGGKDSFKQTWLLRYKYGMNPLTVTWAPNLYTSWGRRNHQAWINSGFDNLLVTPNGAVHGLLTRLAIETLFHPFQPFILGQKMLAPIMAAKFGIGLIFYGENEAEYGNPVADLSTSLRAAEYYTQAPDRDVFLSGLSLEELALDYGIERGDLGFYLPPPPADAPAEVHYLGYYLRWSPASSFDFTMKHASEAGLDWNKAKERTAGTFTDWNSVDDMIDDLHYWTTYIKFGIGRATYDSCQAIRNGQLTREEAIELVRQHDGEFPFRFWKEISEHLHVKPQLTPIAAKTFKALKKPLTFPFEYFLELADKFRPPHLWSNVDGKWRLRHSI